MIHNIVLKDININMIKTQFKNCDSSRKKSHSLNRDDLGTHMQQENITYRAGSLIP
ncbi:hypothetical protein Hanom_Chr13g01209271 [Helianthus anomalus]